MYQLSYGIQGIGIGSLVTNLIVLLQLLGYTYFNDETRGNLQPYDYRSLKGLGVQSSIALPSYIMNCLDWMSFEIIVIFSGFFGVIDQAVCTVLVNVESFTYFLFLGIGQTAAAILGKEIGKNDIYSAKQRFIVV